LYINFTSCFVLCHIKTMFKLWHSEIKYSTRNTSNISTRDLNIYFISYFFYFIKMQTTSVQYAFAYTRHLKVRTFLFVSWFMSIHSRGYGHPYLRMRLIPVGFSHSRAPRDLYLSLQSVVRVDLRSDVRCSSRLWYRVRIARANIRKMRIVYVTYIANVTAAYREFFQHAKSFHWKERDLTLRRCLYQKRLPYLQ